MILMPFRERYAILTTKEDEQFFEGAVAPALQGSRFCSDSSWCCGFCQALASQGFAAVADHLSAKYKVIFVGDAKDAQIVDDIQERMKRLPCHWQARSICGNWLLY
jgi:hypothetical protein